MSLPCNFPTCQGKVAGDGWCSEHLDKYKKNICLFHGCSKKEDALAVCSAHLAVLQRQIDESEKKAAPTAYDGAVTVFKDSTKKEIKDMLADYGVKFDTFASFVTSNDPGMLSKLETVVFGDGAVLKGGKKGESYTEPFLRLFLREHFKMHTKQIQRPLEPGDIDTLLWLHKLYCGKLPDVAQALPYDRAPVNFWKHLLDLEGSLRKIQSVWSLTEPKILYGFLSYAESESLMTKYKQKDSFFYRLSNSEPDKLVFLHWKGDHVSQQKTAMFESIGEFRHAMFRFKHLKPLILPQADGSTHVSTSHRDYLSIVSSPEFELRISKEYLPFRQWYGGQNNNRDEAKHLNLPSPVKSPARRTSSGNTDFTATHATFVPRTHSTDAGSAASHMAALAIVEVARPLSPSSPRGKARK